MTERLRVATLNIWCRHGDWPARREILREGFRALRPDLVALQETVVSDGDDQVAELFGDEYHVIHQGRRTPEGVGCSIVSRWGPVRVDEIDLCVTERVDPEDFPGRSTVAEFDTPLGPVLFVQHKPDWQVDRERERELQAVTTAAEVEKLAADRDVHVILAGDFDARPETASVRFWTGRQSLGDLSVNYQDVWEFARPGESGAGEPADRRGGRLGPHPAPADRLPDGPLQRARPDPADPLDGPAVRHPGRRRFRQRPLRRYRGTRTPLTAQ